MGRVIARRLHVLSGNTFGRKMRGGNILLAVDHTDTHMRPQQDSMARADIPIASGAIDGEREVWS